MAIGNSTGTWNPPTKVDSDSHLAGNQHIPGAIGDAGTYEQHLPWAALVDPLYQDCFAMGHDSSCVSGYVQPSAGHSDI